MLGNRWTSYLAYVVSFATIGASWLGPEEVQFLTQRLTPGLAGYLFLIVVGLFVPVIAVIGYLAIAMFYIIPFRRWRRFPTFHFRRRAGQ